MGEKNIDRRREGALEIVRTLKAKGYETYFVGGCVRDLVMGKEPKDYDIVTNASPPEIMSLFPHTVAVGAHFGVVMVIIEGISYEVATFRWEGAYEDGRHPSRVRFTHLQEDVKRRDFTVNGLAMIPETGEVIDYVGGLADIKRRIIRTIGPPSDRFKEDHLRMLRAVRFASQLGFAIEEETGKAISSQARLIHRISAERIREELTKIITQPGAKRGLLLLMETGLMREVLPEVDVLAQVEQPHEFHPEGDVFTHTVKMFDFMEGEEMDRRLAWAALLHDTGKAQTRDTIDGRVHFYGHGEKSVEIAEKIMERLRFSKEDKECVLMLIKQHMRFMHVKDMAPRTLKKFLRLPHFHLHLALHRLDCLASHGDLTNYYFCFEMLKSLSQEELHPPRLISGHDLIAWGFTPGPLMGKILRSVEDAQLDGKIVTKDEAQAFVMEKWGAMREPRS